MKIRALFEHPDRSFDYHILDMGSAAHFFEKPSRWKEYQLTASRVVCAVEQCRGYPGSVSVDCRFYLRAPKEFADDHLSCSRKTMFWDEVELFPLSFCYYDADNDPTHANYTLIGRLSLPIDCITDQWCRRHWLLAKALIDHSRRTVEQRTVVLAEST
jgi:hypothetical protein